MLSTMEARLFSPDDPYADDYVGMLSLTSFSVWVFARPLSFAMLISPISVLSGSKHHLCHWGVLISTMSVVEMQSIITQNKESLEEHVLELGIMYELCRDEKNLNNVNITRPFTTAHLTKEWRTFSAQYIGKTKVNSQIIDLKAACIIVERPSYFLFENNCQNFVIFLLDAICPDADTPDTIQNVLQRLRDIHQASQTRLPGAYPTSVNSTDNNSFVTASETSWVTASGTSWVTAVESWSSSSGNDLSFNVTIFQPQEGEEIDLGQRNLRFSARFGTAVERVFRGRRAFHNAVLKGDVPAVLRMLYLGLDVSSRGKWGRTPLHIAAQYKWISLVRLLLDAGSDVAARDSFGFTPLHMVMSQLAGPYKVEIIEILLQEGSDIESRDYIYGETPLHMAVSGNKPEIGVVKLLLNSGADVSARDRIHQETPLHRAVSRSGPNIQIIGLLLNAGADLNAENLSGETPLQIASNLNHEEILRVMLERFANSNVPN